MTATLSGTQFLELAKREDIRISILKPLRKGGYEVSYFQRNQQQNYEAPPKTETRQTICSQSSQPQDA